MESEEKETRKFALGIELFYNNRRNIKPKITAANINMPNNHHTTKAFLKNVRRQLLSRI